MSDQVATAPAEAAAERPRGRTLLRAKGLRKRYAMGLVTLEVVKGIDIEVRQGEILAIAGPSGAGKSTLLHMLGLLEPPDAGELVFDDVNVLALPEGGRATLRNEKIGFVFQFYHLLRDLDAVENVCLPAMVRDSVFAYDKRAARARATDLLQRVGLGERLTHRPTQLSGGERQRVAIARALMNDPELLLCDEPTGNLDTQTSRGILELLWKLKDETRATFVIVTHDEDLATRADRAIRVVDGRVVRR